MSKPKPKILIGIYKITSPTNKIYIGQSRNILKRKKRYSLTHCKSQILLHRSIMKYGWDAHRFDIIHYCTVVRLFELEEAYIEMYQSYNTPHGLNLSKGGYGRSMVDESTKKKLSELNKGEKSSFYGKRGGQSCNAKAVDQYYLDLNFIKTWPAMIDIQRELGFKNQAISRACNRKLKSAFGYVWIFHGEIPAYTKRILIGPRKRKYKEGEYKPTEETKRKIGQSNKGKVRDEKTRKNLSDSHKITFNDPANKERLFKNRHYTERAKKVIDTSTMIIYRSGRMAAKNIGIPSVTLSHKLCGRQNNNTTLLYYNDYLRIEQEKLTMVF